MFLLPVLGVFPYLVVMTKGVGAIFIWPCWPYILKTTWYTNFVVSVEYTTIPKEVLEISQISRKALQTLRSRLKDTACHIEGFGHCVSSKEWVTEKSSCRFTAGASRRGVSAPRPLSPLYRLLEPFQRYLVRLGLRWIALFVVITINDTGHHQVATFHVGVLGVVERHLWYFCAGDDHGVF